MKKRIFFIGVELFKASRMFKNVLKSMEKKLQVA